MTVLRFMTMRYVAGAFLTLLALGFAWPSGVQAGCRYPHGVASGRGVAHLDRLAQAGALSVPMDETVPPTPVPPCAGLRCSNDSVPTSPASPVVAPEAEQWGDLPNVAAVPDITSSPWSGDDAAVQPRHRVASPFHPPR